MVSDAEQATTTAGRCEVHPRRQAEFTCDSCGRPLCLTCAIPVRGRVLGAECVQSVTGHPDGAEPRSRTEPGLGPAFVATGAALAVSVAGTILPWSAANYSHYTGPFGGWGFSPLAWSLVATIGALSGLALWAVLWLSAFRDIRSPRRWTITLAAALTVIGTVLYLVWPPFATHPWLGPWVTLVAAVVTLACWLRAEYLRRRTESTVP